MKNFTYFRPTSLKQALPLLDTKWGNTELLAGGTDLLDLQKEYVAQPEKVVSLGGVTEKEWRNINGKKGLGGVAECTIGAGVNLATIAEDEFLRMFASALAMAASICGGPQIRNMGTLGGNLCQRNRCWYFRDEHTNCLLKNGGDKCFALDGENQYHAVFTQGQKCVCVHPSTLAPALIAYGAKATVEGPNGTRTIDLEKFFQAPTKEQREHVLAPNEIVVDVRFNCGDATNFGSASYEVRHKQSYDWPLVQAAVAFRKQDGKADKVRIVLGHVAPTPLLVEDAAKMLEGQIVNETTAAAAGKAATAGAKPLSHNGYKVKLIETAVKRAVLLAAGVKPYWEELTV